MTLEADPACPIEAVQVLGRRHLDSPQLLKLRESMTTFDERFSHQRPLIEASGWKWPRDPLEQWSRRAEYPFVVASLPHPPCRLLDAGSGLTFFDHYLSQAGFDVCACDLDPLVEQTSPLINAALGTSVCATAGSLLQLPYASGTFDSVVCISVLEHLPDPAQAVREAIRVLRVGGRLSLTFDYEYGSVSGRATAARILDAVGTCSGGGAFQLPDMPEDALTVSWHYKHDRSRLWFPDTLKNRLRYRLQRFPELAVIALNCQKLA